MDSMKTDAAGLQDQLTGALIGIARAVDGNEYLISSSTDKIMREGLAAALLGAHMGNDSLSALIRRAEDEKRKLIPHCYECASPCGRTSNYDIRRLCTADEDICSLKLLILCGIRTMAAYACRAAAMGCTDYEVNRFFYQALYAIGDESFGLQELLPVAMKFGKINLRCMALLDNKMEVWKMAYIKNIEHEKVLPLAEEVSVQPGQIVSKTLAQNKAVSVTLFAFSKGEEISTHDSEGDAMVQVLSGVGRFTVGGKTHICKAGDVLVMPAKIPHAVYAEEDFKWILTVVFPFD